MTVAIPTTATTAGYDLLSFFHEEQHDSFLSVAEARVLEKDEVLIAQGEAHSGLFIVTRGVLDIRVWAQEPISVGKRGTGELLGEVSFLTGEGTTATVVAVEHSEVLALPAEALRQQLQQDHAFASRFYQMLGRVVARKLTEQSRRTVPFTLAINEKLGDTFRATIIALGMTSIT